jgi:SAM-dependent methyltransferase
MSAKTPFSSWRRFFGRREASSYDAPLVAADAVPATPELGSQLIRPEDVIRDVSLEELCQTAEEYYRRIPDATPLMAKPFAFVHESPETLENLGHLLSGLQLGTGMRVLDFGAGSCWLSRFLAQLNCHVICVDTSRSALVIGQQLFEMHPPIGHDIATPEFLWFDGKRLDLPDGTVDRIVCFDAFHHVPNQAEVLAEFSRVLRPGGVVGFSEPGRYHSRSPQSQFEMRHHRVLENDIDLQAIFELSRSVGFTSMTAKILTDTELDVADYAAIFDASAHEHLKSRVWTDACDATLDRSIFFLRKGSPRLDSRRHEGLRHELRVVESVVVVRPSSRVVHVRVTARNVGSALWLHTSDGIHGVVRLGTHLYDASGILVNIDHSRHGLIEPVNPAKRPRLKLTFRCPTTATVRCSSIW